VTCVHFHCRRCDKAGPAPDHHGGCPKLRSKVNA
jgi:hypothetical protein